jgi:hypothetical protein
MNNLELLQKDLCEREERLTSSEAENRKLRSQLEAEKGALAIVIGMANRQLGLDLPQNPVTQVPLELGVPVEILSLKQAVNLAIPDLGMRMGYFTPRDVFKYLSSAFPEARLGFEVKSSRPNIARYLSELADRGMIERGERPSGRQPGTYRLLRGAADQPLPLP